MTLPESLISTSVYRLEVESHTTFSAKVTLECCVFRCFDDKDYTDCKRAIRARVAGNFKGASIAEAEFGDTVIIA